MEQLYLKHLRPASGSLSPVDDKLKVVNIIFYCHYNAHTVTNTRVGWVTIKPCCLCLCLCLSICTGVEPLQEAWWAGQDNQTIPKPRRYPHLQQMSCSQVLHNEIHKKSVRGVIFPMMMFLMIKMNIDSLIAHLAWTPWADGGGLGRLLFSSFKISHFFFFQSTIYLVGAIF